MWCGRGRKAPPGPSPMRMDPHAMWQDGMDHGVPEHRRGGAHAAGAEP